METTHWITHPGWALSNDWKDASEETIHRKRNEEHPWYSRDLRNAILDAESSDEDIFLVYDDREEAVEYLKSLGMDEDIFEDEVSTLPDCGRPDLQGVDDVHRITESKGDDVLAIVYGEIYPGCPSGVELTLTNYTDWEIETGVTLPRKEAYEPTGSAAD